MKELAYDNFSKVETPKTNPADSMKKLEATDLEIKQETGANLKNKLDFNKRDIPDPDVLPDPPDNVANDIKSGKKEDLLLLHQMISVIVQMVVLLMI